MSKLEKTKQICGCGHCVNTGECTDSATSVEHGTSVKMNTKSMMF